MKKTDNGIMYIAMNIIGIFLLSIFMLHEVTKKPLTEIINTSSSLGVFIVAIYSMIITLLGIIYSKKNIAVIQVSGSYFRVPCIGEFVTWKKSTGEILKGQIAKIYDDQRCAINIMDAEGKINQMDISVKEIHPLE
ncbi:hypothetical protein [Xenorhabdus ishibashii]|uniref:Uncharacterized protein n=1 Tax=Xenorhabdus ishibashii TaxID=1034471 RepID=A0A2D0K801_9GAMM|nr:hypothetical protein [Xenorhabdus ishibashii]PHM59505.1 hypothetical protein Xish_03623 [Xenorhabdus ishibashii]